MKSSDTLDFEKDSAFEGEHNEFVNKDNETFEKIIYIPTLPSTFNNLVEKTVKIETEKPRDVIELLGDLLGVKDYKTNKAAFWFLDIIALQVIRYKNCLDDHYRSVLISWLAGEMKLIRDKKLLRKDFFKEMRLLFLYAAEKLSSGERLPHWELLMDAYSEITKLSQNTITNASVNSKAECLITNKSSEMELIAENDEHMSQENKLSFIRRDLKNHNNENSVTNDLQEETLKDFKTPLTTKYSQTDTFIDAIGSSSLINPSDVLDAIVEATYNMYANELRYALIYAVFVKPIQIQIFHIPSDAFRIPRQIKLADPRGPFHLQLRERLEKVASESINNDKKFKGKKTADNTREKEIINDLDIEIPPTPRSSLNEEETLANYRRFILPLIESNEAMQIFEMHAGNM
ncbi:PREDICTED: uncharacterized protein LOC105458909 isoform X2 [Wasmannia auropunctata]|uniref:uncharacterized protein LOC105458909 isoform X2 n=1 Tax=Wasmannia auropunctata TaxID=64793 RepID=UPI0005EE05CF|nr:PREDICTED: uncharacterized protein LOC105458909 isoform X2 [Wasmannia auropunctata]